MKKYILLLIIIITCLASNIAYAQCTDNSNVWNKSWLSCKLDPNPNPLKVNSHWLLYEFNQPESIAGSHIWNANKQGEIEYGVKELAVDYSVDGANWIELGVFTIPMATGQDNYEGIEGPDFGGVFVQKILLTVLDTYGDNSCASIGEIQLNVNPDACYGTIDACGNCNGTGELTWYLDADGDGLGSAETTLDDCTQPPGYVDNAADYCDNGLLGWNKVSSIFSDNGCTDCHGDNALGGLDLSSFETMIAGGNNCGTNILTGTTLVDIITINNYAACGTPIGFPSMNERVGGNMDSVELALLQTWIDAGTPEDCNCLAGATDLDNDGACDAIDDCPGFDNTLIGTTCDDGDACTENDLWRSVCDCVGTPATDTDNDGVCDMTDASPENPCTADGTIDGNEPSNWTALPTNDCDGDLINNANGDILDFDACIDNMGQVSSVSCSCENDFILAGGYYEGQTGLSGVSAAASGLPDGIFTGPMSGIDDNLILSFPYLARGEQICITVGFSDVNGIVRFDLNYNAFSYSNTSGTSNYEPQEFCFTTFQEGPQTVVVSEIGTGIIKVDGATYAYCGCSDSDPKAATPACTCPGNISTEKGIYESSAGLLNAEMSTGAADGLWTSALSNTDTLILKYPNIQSGNEICVTLGFNYPTGMASIELNGKLHYASNLLKDSTYLLPQEFCFTNIEEGPQSIIIKDIGGGSVKIDGSVAKKCYSCPDSDSTAEGITTACSCEEDVAQAGGYYEGQTGIGGVPAAASGVPDDIFTSPISGIDDNLTLSFPYLARGEEICITVGFSDVNGIVRFDLNDNPFIYPNTSGTSNYEAQEFCFTTFQEGPQTVVISEIGGGIITMDGSTYAYCDCSDSDPKAATPACTCPGDVVVEKGIYEYSAGLLDPEMASGAANGLWTNVLSDTDTLILKYPNIQPGSEICVTLSFNYPTGMASIDLNGKLHYASNLLKDSTYLLSQEFCFTNTEEGPQSIIIKDIGGGSIKVDGSVSKNCSSCLDNTEEPATTFCACEDDVALAGGYYEGQTGIGGVPAAASGVPDDIFTSPISGINDNLTLSFPYLARGEEICITLGFSDVNGIVRFDLNDNPFIYPNTSGTSNYEPQEFCFTTFQEGPQTLVVSEIGGGIITIDGSTYAYCDCSDSDPKAATPDCTCPDNVMTEPGIYESSSGLANPIMAAGAADGLWTGILNGNNPLILNYPDIQPGNEICVTLSFNNPLGVASIELNGKLHYASNILKDSTYLLPQEFCFTNTEEGPQSIIIKDIGSGTIKVDGSVYKYCPDCVDVQLSAMLEGPYNSLTNKMNTTLNTLGLLPGQIPQIIILPPTPAGQPYNTSPWNYSGTEGADWTNSDYSEDMVDWVLVSFRTGINKSTEISQAAAVIDESGSLYFPACPLFNQDLTELYVVIEHRNHVGVMTLSPVPVLNGVLIYDFWQNDSYKDTASFGQKQLPSGEWVMFAGDADQSDMPSYDIQGQDKDAWLQKNGIFNQYSNTDFNLNGDTNGADKALWSGNNGVSSRVPK